jgi:hypothetical protein
VARFVVKRHTELPWPTKKNQPPEQVISLIGRHTKQLAELARDQGCTTLYYLLHAAAEQAEKELAEPRGNGESGVS